MTDNSQYLEKSKAEKDISIESVEYFIALDNECRRLEESGVG